MAKAQRNWEQFALLLIDVQGDFWSKRMAQSFPDFPAHIARLLAFCRSEGLEIIHLRAIFQPDRSDWMPTYKLRGRIPCVQGTAGAETLPFALDEPGEAVITKQTFDGFHNPELLRHLQQGGKRFVLTAGLVTSVCVFLTAASATQNGFLSAIVEDCCADRPETHEQTLDTYQFMFQRTTLGLIPEHHSEWLAVLKTLDE
jgi:nicotinamidase-related amidase